MDALSSLGIDWKLLVAQAVNFLVLWFVLRRFAYRPMLEFLEKRTKRIERGIRDAEHAKKQLEEAAAKEQQMMADAREEANSIIARAEIAAEKHREAMMAEMVEHADMILREAKEHATQERDRIFREAKAEIAALVVLATEKVLKEKIDTEKGQELARKFLGKNQE